MLGNALLQVEISQNTFEKIPVDSMLAFITMCEDKDDIKVSLRAC